MPTVPASSSDKTLCAKACTWLTDGIMSSDLCRECFESVVIGQPAAVCLFIFSIDVATLWLQITGWPFVEMTPTLRSKGAIHLIWSASRLEKKIGGSAGSLMRLLEFRVATFKYLDQIIIRMAFCILRWNSPIRNESLSMLASMDNDSAWEWLAGCTTASRGVLAPLACSPLSWVSNQQLPYRWLERKLSVSPGRNWKHRDQVAVDRGLWWSVHRRWPCIALMDHDGIHQRDPLPKVTHPGA